MRVMEAATSEAGDTVSKKTSGYKKVTVPLRTKEAASGNAFQNADLPSKNARGLYLSEQMLPQAESIALRRLIDRPDAMVSPDIVKNILAKGFVERRAGLLIVTSRGHAALLRYDNSDTPTAGI